MYRNHIITPKSIIIVDDVKGPIPVPVENPLYLKIKEAIRSMDTDKVMNLVDRAANIKVSTNGRFWVENGVVHCNNGQLPDVMSKRVIQFTEASVDVDPIMNFWDNLSQNPSVESKKDLYAFLEHNNIPLTEDGCFIAYKRVNEDFLDFHTRSFDNSVGKVIEMDRSKVNPDRETTCSYGLHVAAFRYAKETYSDGHLLEVKVNPRDVVAVPIDYNNEKMRVCRYEVVALGGCPRREIVYPKYHEGQALDARMDNGNIVSVTVVSVNGKENSENEYIVKILGTEDTFEVLESNLVPIKADDEDEAVKNEYGNFEDDFDDLDEEELEDLDEDDDEDDDFEDDEDEDDSDDWDDEDEDEEDEKARRIENAEQEIQLLKEGQNRIEKTQKEILNSIKNLSKKLDE